MSNRHSTPSIDNHRSSIIDQSKCHRICVRQEFSSRLCFKECQIAISHIEWWILFKNYKYRTIQHATNCCCERVDLTIALELTRIIDHRRHTHTDIRNRSHKQFGIVCRWHRFHWMICQHVIHKIQWELHSVELIRIVIQIEVERWDDISIFINITLFRWK